MTNLKGYVKAILYVYPFLKTVEKDYEDHILNKAVLSYRGNVNADKLAEYIAGQILEKRNLVWLKGCVDRVLKKLSDTEKMLVQMRYFGKRKKIKRGVSCPTQNAGGQVSLPCERKYFRLQNRLVKKLTELFAGEGICEETFAFTFEKMPLFHKAYTLIRREKDKGLSQTEKEWLGA